MHFHPYFPPHCHTMIILPISCKCRGESWQLPVLVKSHLVTGENTDAVSGEDVPQTDGAVRRACGHVICVGMETSASDVGQVTGEYPQRLVVIGRPQAVGERAQRDKSLH